ncbi:MAG: glycoside hydrolase family 5 protein [Eubacteriales bacterium]|nr:glycoside hydrolase family 5 protein [Eubacteriales bacterium]
MRGFKKLLLVTLACIGIFALSIPAYAQNKSVRPSVNGALHVEGTLIKDKNNQMVQLKGVSTHGLAWFPQYVNEISFKDMRTLFDADLIRLALYTEEYGGYCSGGNQTELMNLIRKGIKAATDSDMYVIVDWHILSDCDPMRHKDEAIRFFDTVSREYKDAENIIYEICNEPNGGTGWAQIKGYAEAVIPVIRKNDPDAIILIGTPNWSQYVDEAAANPVRGYDNLMYTLHFYAGTHKDDLRKRLENTLKSGLPVFISEFSICDASGNGALDYYEAAKWMELINRNQISFVTWNLSNKNESSALIKPECGKTGYFTENDLSPAGRWFRSVGK